MRVRNKWDDGGAGKALKIYLIRQTGQTGELTQPKWTIKPFCLVLELTTLKSREEKSGEKVTSDLLGGRAVPLVTRYSEGLRQAKYASDMAASAIMFSLLKGII